MLNSSLTTIVNTNHSKPWGLLAFAGYNGNLACKVQRSCFSGCLTRPGCRLDPPALGTRSYIITFSFTTRNNQITFSLIAICLAHLSRWRSQNYFLSGRLGSQPGIWNNKISERDSFFALHHLLGIIVLPLDDTQFYPVWSALYLVHISYEYASYLIKDLSFRLLIFCDIK